MIKELQNDINNDSVSHAYFLECNDERKGLGEAKEFAIGILGGSLENNPDCNIFTTSEKSIKVDSIRELQKDISVKPLMYSRKIYIIPEA